MAYKISDACIGCGACESICDAVFVVEDRASVKESGIVGNEDCVREAADACPVGAIDVAYLIFVRVGFRISEPDPFLLKNELKIIKFSASS